MTAVVIRRYLVTEAEKPIASIELGIGMHCLLVKIYHRMQKLWSGAIVDKFLSRLREPLVSSLISMKESDAGI
jgi:hypothetical protein